MILPYKKLCLFCCICLLLSHLVGCSSPSQSSAETSQLETKYYFTPAEKYSYTPYEYNELYWRKYSTGHGLVDRTTWNIEVNFLELTEKGLRVEIYDHDNLGFVIDMDYFMLERQIDDQWVRLTWITTNPDKWKSIYCVYPSDNRDYVYITDECMFAHMPGVILESGHYRITKVVGGKEFSGEFDLTLETPIIIEDYLANK